MFFDPRYFLFMLPGLLLAAYAAIKTQSTFRRYSRVGAASGMTGAQAARALLAAHGLGGINIQMARGFLSDHYDPSARALRLSPEVYNSPSLAAIGVACHEAGHALQHADGYAPLALRSQLVPITQFGSQLAFPIIIAGLLFQAPFFVNLGILLFAAVVAFTIVTLPVEWNASARAKRLMVNAGIVSPREAPAAAAVLNAAFLTYIASTVTAVLQLLYYLSLARRR